VIDRHTDNAVAVARETGWSLGDIAEDNDWAGVGLGPVGQTRDSDELARSNFQVITEDLQERYPDETEIVRFGHWACGWIEEIAYNAGNADLRTAIQAWRDKLDNYPIADEEHYSELETSELYDYFASEIQRFEIPAGVTIAAISAALTETGDVSRAEDLDDDRIQTAIDEAEIAAKIAAATPPETQLQLVTEHGRPHTATADEIEPTAPDETC
jgi:hypothetical protein